MRLVVLLVALAMAPFSEQQQQLDAEIGLIAVDGSEEVLPNDETIVQYADAASTSLFCKSTVTWDQGGDSIGLKKRARTPHAVPSMYSSFVPF